jgi:hypothetical protein
MMKKIQRRLQKLEELSYNLSLKVFKQTVNGKKCIIIKNNIQMLLLEKYELF